jgi:predicted SnoaL-like aldol condensation-catalyzing enzyme
MSTSTSPEQNKALVLKAIETLFNKRDYAAAERFWSESYIQHSAHVPPGREGLFGLARSFPDTLRYEHGPIVADGDYVMFHSRFSNFGAPRSLITMDIVRIENGRIAEHWDVWENEANKAESQCGSPMFGDRFPD